jgi:hypothetical protein
MAAGVGLVKPWSNGAMTNSDGDVSHFARVQSYASMEVSK